MWATAGGLRVTAPPRASYSAIEDALMANGTWLREQMAAWAPAPAPRDGDAVPFGDLRLAVRLAETSRASLDLGAREIRLPELGSERDRLGALERLYRREARSRLTALCHGFSAPLGVQVARVRISDPRSRWGSCSTSGTISLSWRLMMAPTPVAKSICAHEVAHLVVPNHSRAFRDVLEQLIQDAADCERWLSAHGRALLRGPLAAAATPPLSSTVPVSGLLASLRT